jgi:cytochrome c556
MINRKAILARTVLPAAALAAVLAAGSALPQTALQSPAGVQRALGTLKRVVDHTQRLISARNYARLPHENDEFKEGLDALEQSIVKDPADLRAHVEALLKQAQAGSQGIADAAAAHDDARLEAAHAALADSVKAVLAAFPTRVQP